MRKRLKDDGHIVAGGVGSTLFNSPMIIGLAFTLKSDVVSADRPDDWQEEFDSPATVAAIRSALEANGHRVVELGDGRNLVKRLLSEPPELVFNIAEGTGVGRSREARVPAICELLNIPCTGSDPLTLAATLDKDVARRLVASHGIAVPKGMVISSQQPIDPTWGTYPAIVKPAWEGSSKGIRGKCVVHTPAGLRKQVDLLSRDYQQPILVEEFIAGDELTVGILGNDPPKVLGTLHVIPKQPTKEFVYGLEVKRDWQNRVRYECPPKFEKSLLSIVETAASKSYQVLGCRDVARIDFRLRDSIPYFIEANPLPGLHPDTGDIMLIATAMGVTHKQLIGAIIESAVQRNKNRI
jgi:D-alanine-D-alanine ligase